MGCHSVRTQRPACSYRSNAFTRLRRVRCARARDALRCHGDGMARAGAAGRAAAVRRAAGAGVPQPVRGARARWQAARGRHSASARLREPRAGERRLSFVYNPR